MYVEDCTRRTLEHFGISDEDGYPCTVTPREAFQRLAVILYGSVDFRKKFRVTIDYDPDYENVLIRDKQVDPVSFPAISSM